jgi:hypothetical protein
MPIEVVMSTVETTPGVPHTTTGGNGSEPRFAGSFASFAINQVSEADPADIQAVGASNLCLLESFYKVVRSQAQRSFFWALVAASIGCLFFLSALIVFLAVPNESSLGVSLISLISGALVQVIAGLNFYLFGRAQAQLASFHCYLDRTQRFLLANSICERLTDPERQTARAELVKVIANAGMIFTEHT